MRKLAAVVAALACFAVHAADKVKIGFVSTLSGPNAAIGGDIRDAFNLAIKLNGGKLGGLPAEVLVNDDQLKPENAKQIVERYLRRDKVDFVTGAVFSNIVVAIAPDVITPRPSSSRPTPVPPCIPGAQCNPFFFVSSWPSEAYSEAAGQYVTCKGLSVSSSSRRTTSAGTTPPPGFKRYYKGKLRRRCTRSSGSSTMPPSSRRSAPPSPRRCTCSCRAAWASTSSSSSSPRGSPRTCQLIVPLWGSDQDIIRAVGDPMLGLFSVGHWSLDLDNAANKNSSPSSRRRTTACRPATPHRLRHGDADRCGGAQGQGEDRGQGGAARGAARPPIQERARQFKFGPNQFPVQSYYLQLVGKGSDGRMVHKTIGTVLRPCRRLCAGLQDEVSYIPAEAPALAHCSSWSPVTPLTPTAPVTLPSTMMGTPPGEANTPGSVAVAGPPLLITSAKARVGR